QCIHGLLQARHLCMQTFDLLVVLRLARGAPFLEPSGIRFLIRSTLDFFYLSNRLASAPCRHGVARDRREIPATDCLRVHTPPARPTARCARCSAPAHDRAAARFLCSMHEMRLQTCMTTSTKRLVPGIRCTRRPCCRAGWCRSPPSCARSRESPFAPPRLRRGAPDLSLRDRLAAFRQRAATCSCRSSL